MTPSDLELMLSVYDKNITQYRANLAINPDDQYSKKMLRVIDQRIVSILNTYHNEPMS
jgi:hypothetical protein